MQAELRIGWTTIGSQEAGEKLARDLVGAGLAACVQIESLVGSIYRWEGAVRQDPEWRLTVKFSADKADCLEAWINEKHPYACPQWIVVRPEQVSAGYLNWATGQGPLGE
ncbi:MAG: divalent-cation tolerance protein CutA [Coraliomargaritaceae bacterium]